jgi:hypothetical protein
MFLIQRDHVVQDLAPALSIRRSAMPFCQGARTLVRFVLNQSPLRNRSPPHQLSVAVQNHVMVTAGFRKCFPPLLHDPFRRGM